MFWEVLLEWSAGLFGATVRSRLGQLVLYCLALVLLALTLYLRWGPGALLLPALMVIFPVLAARQVAAARGEVWRAACLALDEPGQRPEDTRSGLVAPTATSLGLLAKAIDDVRRGRYVAANELLPSIHRDLLRPEEVQLLDGVRAMISLGIGSTKRAAQQAAAVLPTGSDELDVCLGRTVVSEAWNDPVRLAAIAAAWRHAGVEGGPLSRLERLVRLRLDLERIQHLEMPEARDLSDEARAVGDDELASELDARSRANAYR